MYYIYPGSSQEMTFLSSLLLFPGFQRDGIPFGRSFGKAGSMRGENPFYRKKWVFTPHIVLSGFKPEERNI